MFARPCHLYVADVSPLAEESTFQYYFQLMHPVRQEKILRLAHKEDQMRSLGAGILFRTACINRNMPYDSLQIQYGKNGKPFAPDYPKFHFNLSHSGSQVILGISPCEIGVDVEMERMNVLGVSQRFFSKDEKEWVHSVKNTQTLVKRFFQIWTCKESYVKAMGDGLRSPFQSFSVPGENGERFQCYIFGEHFSFWHRRTPEGYHYSVCLKELDGFFYPKFYRISLALEEKKEKNCEI